MSGMFPGRMTRPCLRIWALLTLGPAAILILVPVQVAQAQIRAPARVRAAPVQGLALMQLGMLRLMLLSLLRTQPRTSHIPNVCAGMRLLNGKTSASLFGPKPQAEKLVTWFCAGTILGHTTALGAHGVLPGMTSRSVTWCFAG